MARFKNIKKLGSGGFCEVWECVREDDGEHLAKKVLLDESEEAIKRFQREVRILSKLDHPRIVKVVAKHLQEPPFWYAMPVYQHSLRSTLNEVVGKQERIAKIYSMVLEGMQYAHGEGIIHRDLKPENILFNNDRDLVISDFGLGRALDAETSRKTYTGEWLGTFAYMAPEQLQDAKRADVRSDIFSLGRILYELYTGSIPGAVQDLTTLPIGIASIVDLCTKNDPNQRLQSVKELHRSFKLVVGKERKATAPEELQKLLEEVRAQGHANPEQVKRMIKLIADCEEEAELLHEFAAGLPEAAFGSLTGANPTVAKMLVNQFATVAVSQGWPFEYTDTIGAACERIYRASKDPQIKARVAAVALEVGVSHNRYYVMDVAARLIAITRDDGEARVLAHALLPIKKYLAAITDRLNVSKLNPHIREVFELAEGE